MYRGLLYKNFIMTKVCNFLENIMDQMAVMI
jgi:hypothetical protein